MTDTLKPLPKGYAWLDEVDQPARILTAMRRLYGTLETPGPGDNPTIMAWAREVGGEVAETYRADAIPWCGLAMAVAARRAGYEPPRHPLWALSWSAFGDLVDEPGLGDVLVFVRRDAQGKRVGGHVGVYVGEDSQAFHVLGGNQSDAVTVARIRRKNLYAARQCPWRIGRPPSALPRRLTSGGLPTEDRLA